MSTIRERVKARFRQSTFLSIGEANTKKLQQPQEALSSIEAAPSSPLPPMSNPQHSNSTKTEADLQRLTELNQLQSPFLCLPGEVRNRIYHHAVGGHEIYAMASGLRRFVCMARPDSQFAWRLQPIAHIMAIQFPLVCRQIRAEMGKYFVFKFNTFGATMPEYFAMLLEALTMEQRRCVEVVKVNFVMPRAGESAQSLQRQFVGLIMLKRLRMVVLRDLGEMEEGEREEVVRVLKTVAKKNELVVEIERIG